MRKGLLRSGSAGAVVLGRASGHGLEGPRAGYVQRPAFAGSWAMLSRALGLCAARADPQDSASGIIDACGPKSPDSHRVVWGLTTRPPVPLRAFLRLPVCPPGSFPSSAFLWFPFARRSPVCSLRPSLPGSGSPSVSLRVPFPLSDLHVSAAGGRFRRRWSREAGTKVTTCAAALGAFARVGSAHRRIRTWICRTVRPLFWRDPGSTPVIQLEWGDGRGDRLDPRCPGGPCPPLPVRPGEDHRRPAGRAFGRLRAEQCRADEAQLRRPGARGYAG
jgi:hypothetical protein